MTHRVKNFGAGPSALPLAVLERMREELLDFRGSGMSILECSHRGPVYGEVHRAAESDLRELLSIPDDYAVLFMTGGARTQFSVVAMNLLPPGRSADYLTTGHWSELALEAAIRVGVAREAWSSAATGHDRVPRADQIHPAEGAAYLHYTSNNTIYGTQYPDVPEAGDTPLVCDMSSDVASRPVDVSRFGVIYAGAQKNLGTAGVTAVIVRSDLLERSPASLPDTLSYRRMAEKSSLVNTPPAFAIYILGLVVRHWLDHGGVAAAAERNARKAALLYGAIDGSDGFYRGHAVAEARSEMNVTFRLPSAELERRFLEEAATEELAALKGHRSVGGVRASIYNVAELAAVEALVAFMAEFRRRHG